MKNKLLLITILSTFTIASTSAPKSTEAPKATDYHKTTEAPKATDYHKATEYHKSTDTHKATGHYKDGEDKESFLSSKASGLISAKNFEFCIKKAQSKTDINACYEQVVLEYYSKVM